MKRLLRMFIEVGLVLFAVLFLVSVAMSISAALGYHWMWRRGPADERLWSIRHNARDFGQFYLVSIAPWPHVQTSGWAWGRKPFPAPADGIMISIGTDPSRTIELNNWEIPGVRFRRTKAIIVTYVAGSPVFNDTPVENWMIWISYWVPTVTTGIPVLAWGVVSIWRWRQRRRRLIHGTCPACGYDLRATLDRCPECGRVVSPPRTSDESDYRN